MKTIGSALIAATLACSFVLFTSAEEAARANETVLHSFGSGTDGQSPYSSLVGVKGTLYGTTVDGGTHGDGTVFALDPGTSAEKVLYSFCRRRNCVDGANPVASLIDMNGTLYGTTYDGGTSDGGSVFAIDRKTGAEKVLYSFCSQKSCTDGEYPAAGLIDVTGTLYGTTFFGGINSSGTVFALDPNTGTEKLLYTFCSRQLCTDGGNPVASPIDVNGMLYGTTTSGGLYPSDGGTVFALDPNSGAENVLYTFCSQQNCTDGATPAGSLVEASGTLYGTTEVGGSTGCNGQGCGTVFAVDPSTGTETVLYSFTGGLDGGLPTAGLIDVNGTLYGTTSSGGTSGKGTAFALDPNTGTETVLYSFCSRKKCKDGEEPYAGLTDVKGTLYGTTVYGGATGFGTVFALKP
ncbi:MAG TPA: PQQ-binding-like beta-propeller repeat protein [Rhizomicrobium sp.]|jgi:uncharacterized repeat protein (TIGR03803 family)